MNYRAGTPTFAEVVASLSKPSFCKLSCHKKPQKLYFRSDMLTYLEGDTLTMQEKLDYVASKMRHMKFTTCIICSKDMWSEDATRFRSCESCALPSSYKRVCFERSSARAMSYNI